MTARLNTTMRYLILNEGESETRVSLLPDSALAIFGNSFTGMVEKGAGWKASRSDADYESAGLKVVSREEGLRNADLVLGILPLSDEELQLLPDGASVWGMYQPQWHPERLKVFESRKLNLYSLDCVPRITRAQSMDVLSSMATASGYQAVLEAAAALPRFFPMLMTAAGTIAPAKVLVIGAGVAGLQAIATAKRLGAVVEAFDTRPSVKEQVESLGGKFVEVEGAKEDKAAGGYAVEQDADYQRRQAEAIAKAVAKSDVVITTAQIPGRKAPLLITEEMIAAMKSGAVVVDMAVSTGGNCALSKPGTHQVQGITIIGDSFLQRQKAEDASRMYAKNLQNLFKLFIKEGKFQPDFNDEIVRGCCVVREGVNQISQ